MQLINKIDEFPGYLNIRPRRLRYEEGYPRPDREAYLETTTRSGTKNSSHADKNWHLYGQSSLSLFPGRIIRQPG